MRRDVSIGGKKPLVAPSKLLIGLDSLAHVARGAEELQVVYLVVATPTDRVFVVDLKVAAAMDTAAISATALLGSEEPVLDVPGNDAPASA